MIWKLYASIFALCIAIQALTGWDFLGQFFTALENPLAMIAFLIFFCATVITDVEEKV